MTVPARTLRGAPSMSQAPLVQFEQTMEEAFPVIDPQHRPCGKLILIQYRSPKFVSSGGIHLVSETAATIQWNNQIAKVLLIGPTAFCNQDTLAPWPEGRWCKEGDFVRVGKYGQDKWEVPLGKTRDEGVVIFGLVEDLQITAIVPPGTDPLSIIAFV